MLLTRTRAEEEALRHRAPGLRQLGEATAVHAGIEVSCSAGTFPLTPIVPFHATITLGVCNHDAVKNQSKYKSHCMFTVGFYDPVSIQLN